ncbi:gp58 [Listeria phage P40]|uniref:gp58 n=1 Tax=Listeria phage P40 TaxID=560178 RepID=UPI0001819907|nr:gp58 [Listeria phage P40]ACI00418.1 gp58 [Listeria phage P40]
MKNIPKKRSKIMPRKHLLGNIMHTTDTISPSKFGVRKGARTLNVYMESRHINPRDYWIVAGLSGKIESLKNRTHTQGLYVSKVREYPTMEILDDLLPHFKEGLTVNLINPIRGFVKGNLEISEPVYIHHGIWNPETLEEGYEQKKHDSITKYLQALKDHRDGKVPEPPKHLTVIEKEAIKSLVRRNRASEFHGLPQPDFPVRELMTIRVLDGKTKRYKSQKALAEEWNVSIREIELVVQEINESLNGYYILDDSK